MAYYDSETNKIVGAKKGTLTYLHEEGHKIYYLKGYTKQMDSYTYTFMVWSIFLLAFGFTFLGQIAASFVISFPIMEEVVCWIYAFSKYKNNRK